MTACIRNLTAALRLEIKSINDTKHRKLVIYSINIYSVTHIFILFIS